MADVGKLYDNIIKSGVATSEQIGTKEYFINSLKNEKNADILYKKLTEAGVGADKIGDYDYFTSGIRSFYNTQQGQPIDNKIASQNKALTENEIQAAASQKVVDAATDIRGLDETFIQQSKRASEYAAKIAPQNELYFKSKKKYEDMIKPRIVANPNYMGQSPSQWTDNEINTAKSLMDKNRKVYEENSKRLTALQEPLRPKLIEFNNRVVAPELRRVSARINQLTSDRHKDSYGMYGEVSPPSNEESFLGLYRDYLLQINKSVQVESSSKYVSLVRGLAPKEWYNVGDKGPGVSGVVLGLLKNATSVIGLANSVKEKALIDKYKKDPNSLTTDEQLGIYALYLKSEMPNLQGRSSSSLIGEGVLSGLGFVGDMMLTAPIGGVAEKATAKVGSNFLGKLMLKSERFTKFMGKFGIRAEVEGGEAALHQSILKGTTQEAFDALSNTGKASLENKAKKGLIRSVFSPKTEVVNGVETALSKSKIAAQNLAKGVNKLALNVPYVVTTTPLMPSTYNTMLAEMNGNLVRNESGQIEVDNQKNFVQAGRNALIDMYLLNTTKVINPILSKGISKLTINDLTKTSIEAQELSRKAIWTHISDLAGFKEAEVFKNPLSLYISMKETDIYHAWAGDKTWKQVWDKKENWVQFWTGVGLGFPAHVATLAKVGGYANLLRESRHEVIKLLKDPNIPKEIRPELMAALSGNKTSAEIAKALSSIKIKDALEAGRLTPKQKEAMLKAVTGVVYHQMAKGATPEDIRKIENMIDPEKQQAEFDKFKAESLKTRHENGNWVRVTVESEHETNADGTKRTYNTWAKKGNLEFNPDGTLNKDKTDKEITVYTGDGVELQKSLDQVKNARVVKESAIDKRVEQVAKAKTQQQYFGVDAASRAVEAENKIKEFEDNPDKKHTINFASAEDVPEQFQDRVTAVKNARVGGLNVYGLPFDRLDEKNQASIENNPIVTDGFQISLTGKEAADYVKGQQSLKQTGEVREGETLTPPDAPRVTKTKSMSLIGERLNRLSDTQFQSLAQELGLSGASRDEIASHYTQQKKLEDAQRTPDFISKIDNALKDTRLTSIGGMVLSAREEAMTNDIIAQHVKNSEGGKASRAEAIRALMPVFEMHRTIQAELEGVGKVLSIDEIADHFYGGIAPGMKEGLLKQEVKGTTSFDGSRSFVGLMETADVSTVAHEFAGHIGRRMATFLAQELGAQSSFGKIFYSAMKQIGLMETEGRGKNAAHIENRNSVELAKAEERFARGFERFLATGKANSPELVELFSTYKAWMANIYKTVINGQIEESRYESTELAKDKIVDMADKKKGEAALENLNKVYRYLLSGTGMDRLGKASDLLETAMSTEKGTARGYEILSEKVLKYAKEIEKDTQKTDADKIELLRREIKELTAASHTKLTSTQYNAIIKRIASAIKNKEKFADVYSDVNKYILNDRMTKLLAAFSAPRDKVLAKMRTESYRLSIRQATPFIKALLTLQPEDLFRLNSQQIMDNYSFIMNGLVAGRVSSGTGTPFESITAIQRFVDYLSDARKLFKVKDTELTPEAQEKLNDFKTRIANNEIPHTEIKEFLGNVEDYRNGAYYEKKFKVINTELMSDEAKAEYKDVAEKKSIDAIREYMDTHTFADKEVEKSERGLKRLEDYANAPKLPASTYEELMARKKDINQAVRQVRKLQDWIAQESPEYTDANGKTRTLSQEQIDNFESRLVKLAEMVDRDVTSFYDENGKISAEEEKSVRDELSNAIDLSLGEVRLNAIDGGTVYSKEMMAQVDILDALLYNRSGWDFELKDLNNIDIALYNLANGTDTKLLLDMVDKAVVNERVHTIGSDQLKIMNKVGFVLFGNGSTAGRNLKAGAYKMGSFKIIAYDADKLALRLMARDRALWNTIVGDGKGQEVRQLTRPSEKALRDFQHFNANANGDYHKLAEGISQGNRTKVFMTRREMEWRNSNSNVPFSWGEGADKKTFTGTYREFMDSDAPQEAKDKYKNYWAYILVELEAGMAASKSNEGPTNRLYKSTLKGFGGSMTAMNKYIESIRDYIGQKIDADSENPLKGFSEKEKAFYNWMGEYGNRMAGMERMNALRKGVYFEELVDYVPHVAIAGRGKEIGITEKEFEGALNSMNGTTKAPGSIFQRATTINAIENNPDYVFPNNIRKTSMFYFLHGEYGRTKKTLDGVKSLYREQLKNNGGKDYSDYVDNTMDAIWKAELEIIKRTVINEYREGVEFMNKLNGFASAFALARGPRLISEFVSNLPRAGYIIWGEGSNPVGVLTKSMFSSQKDFRRLAEMGGSGLSESINPYLEHTTKLYEKYGAKIVSGYIKLADNMIAVPAMRAIVEGEFKKATGQKFNVEEYLKGGEYTRRHASLINDLLVKADNQIEGMFVARDKASGATKYRMTPVGWYVSVNNPVAQFFKWMARMATNDAYYSMLGFKYMLNGDIGKGASQIAARWTSNIIYLHLMKTLGVGITAAYAGSKGMVYDETHKLIKMNLEETLDFATGQMWDQFTDPKGSALAATFQLIIGGHAGTAKLVQGITMDWINSSRRADLSVSRKEYILRALKDAMSVRNISELTYTRPLSLKNIQLSDVPGPLGFLGSRLTESMSELPPSITRVQLDREDYENMHIHREWIQDYMIRDSWESFLNGTAVTLGMFLPNLISTFGNDIVKNRKNVYVPMEMKKEMVEKGDQRLKDKIEQLQEEIDNQARY